jgi:hypothetical protein
MITIMPIPIIMNQHHGSSLGITGLNYIFVISAALYLCQVLYVIIELGCEQYESKLQVLFELIPFLPFVYHVLYNFYKIGKH